MAMSPQEGTHRLLQAEHEIVGLDSRLTQLNGELRRAEGLISHVPGHQRGLQRHSREIKALRAEVEQLIRDRAVNGQTDEPKLGELTGHVTKLMGDLALLATQVADHEGRLDDHDLKFGSHNERIEAVEVSSITNASAIVALRQRVDEAISPIVWIVALVAAAGAGWFMAVHDWSKAVVNADKSVTTIGNPGFDSGYGIALGALAAFMVVMALGCLAAAFGRNEDSETTSVAAASASSRAMVRTGNPSGPPTAVYPAYSPPPPPPAPRADAGQPVG